MSRVAIRINDHGAVASLAEYPELQKKAIARAITRVADWGRVRIVKAVAANLAVKQGDLNGKHQFGGVTSTRATSDRQEATINITGARIPVFRFGAKPKELPAGKPKGASWMIERGLGRHFAADAFFARMTSGHAAIMWNPRKGPHELIRARSGKRAGKLIWSQRGIRELLGPSIPHVAEERPEFKKLLTVDAGERLELQMQREVNFILTGTSSGGLE